MSLFSDIERTIETGFRRFTERAFGPAQSDDLVLVHRAILEQVGTKIQFAGRGRRIFPYPRIVVTLISPDPDRRALYQAAFGEKLEGALREALERSNCELPRGFSVEVRTAETGVQPFTIEYDYNRPLPAGFYAACIADPGPLAFRPLATSRSDSFRRGRRPGNQPLPGTG